MDASDTVMMIRPANKGLSSRMQHWRCCGYWAGVLLLLWTGVTPTHSTWAYPQAQLENEMQQSLQQLRVQSGCHQPSTAADM